MKIENLTLGEALGEKIEAQGMEREEAEMACRYRKLRRDFVDMGRRAASEIKYLRAQVEALRPKAEAYDLMSKVVHHSLPGAPQGYSEDIAWRIEREIEEVEADNAKPENPEDQLVEVDPRVPDPTRHAHEV